MRDIGENDLQRAEDDLDALLNIMPPHVRAGLHEAGDVRDLIEVVLDLGRPPEARFFSSCSYLSDGDVTGSDLQHITERVGRFGDDNRAGIERTLHRISAIRNRSGDIVGLTCRFGRAIRGSAKVIDDLVVSGKSVLLVGRPGVGKTTILRELARVLADTVEKRVVIVDTSNEIAGDGDIPHPAIGKARRMQVRSPNQQHGIMIEAVENHMPEVIIVDEMGTELEASAARTIAERGVQLIATAHGNTLENLLVNPTLSDLVGGVQTVTLSDEEARRRRTQKTILERKAPPTFDALVEIQSWNRVAVHTDVARTVDAVLRGRVVSPEVRELEENGSIKKYVRRLSGDPEFEVAPFQEPRNPGHVPRRTLNEMAEEARQQPDPNSEESGAIRVHPFGVSHDRLEEASRQAGVAIVVAGTLDNADIMLTTKAHFRRRASSVQIAQDSGVPVFVLRRNTAIQIVGFLEQMSLRQNEHSSSAELNLAKGEAEDGVNRILLGETAHVDLQPQSSFVRRIQHQIAEQAHLSSRSTGRDPSRRVTIRRR